MNRAVCLGVLLMCGAWVSNTGAATRVWTGTQSGLFSDSRNWTNGIVPRVYDSLEFGTEARFRTVTNDLELSFFSITLKAYDYVFRGNTLGLYGGIVSVYSDATNRFECNIHTYASQAIINYGYFGRMEFAGRLEAFYHPLYLVTSSEFHIRGQMIATNEGAQLIKLQPGIITLEEGATLDGDIWISEGALELATTFGDIPIVNGIGKTRVTVGNLRDAPGEARVLWKTPNRVAPSVPFELLSSGALVLDSRLGRVPIRESIRSINGDGQIELYDADLELESFFSESRFSGRVLGNGRLALAGIAGRLELTGTSPFEGMVEVGNGEFVLNGALPNADVVLAPGTTMEGSGSARSLTAPGATIRPVGTSLRFSETAELDHDSALEISLAGGGSPYLEADEITVGGARLLTDYQDDGTPTSYTILKARVADQTGFDGLPNNTMMQLTGPMGTADVRILYHQNSRGDVVLYPASIVVPPTLSIRRSPEGSSIVSWPLDSTGFQLQHVLNLGSGQWDSTGLPPVETNEFEFYVVDPSASSTGFYRLIQ